MSAPEAISSVENALRNLSNDLLTQKLGDRWWECCGLSSEKIERWKDRQAEEERRFGHRDDRIYYYSDFYDLKAIITKNWDSGFSQVLGGQAKFRVYLDVLESFRNPLAHQRDLLPFQTNLAIGISGSIRSDITKYYSAMENGEEHYAKIEGIVGSLGFSWNRGSTKSFHSDSVLHPGDRLEYTISATDPQGGQISYLAYAHTQYFDRPVIWSLDNAVSVEIEERHVGKQLMISLSVRSDRRFHAEQRGNLGGVDDHVNIWFEVRPPKP